MKIRKVPQRWRSFEKTTFGAATSAGSPDRDVVGGGGAPIRQATVPVLCHQIVSTVWPKGSSTSGRPGGDKQSDQRRDHSPLHRVLGQRMARPVAWRTKHCHRQHFTRRRHFKLYKEVNLTKWFTITTKVTYSQRGLKSPTRFGPIENCAHLPPFFL